MPVSKRLRYEILRRDNHTCRYCGASAPDATLTVDHVIAVALGGDDAPSNLVAACKDCNAGKSSTTTGAPIVADVDQRAIAWSRAMEKAATERHAIYYHKKIAVRDFLEIWNRWTWTDFRGDKHNVDLPDDFRVSVAQFYDAGLVYDDFEELIEVAMTSKSRDIWKYFCGCCWRRIRQSQERALEILEDSENGS